MALLVDDVARSLLAATASDAGLQLAVNWLNDRYRELVSRARTRQLRHLGSLYVPAPVSAGTVSVTAGSTSVVLATPLTQSCVGWTFRAATVWYVIIAQASDNVTLTLDSAYSEDTNTAASYYLVKRFVPVAADARWISSVLHPRRRRRLREKMPEQLSAQYPSRQLVGAFPWCWTEASKFAGTTDISGVLGTAGQKLIEIYPPSSQAETYQYYYWTVPSSLALGSTLPPEVEEYVLREGGLVDVWRYKSEQAAQQRPANVELAGYYANREMRQRTVWEQKIADALVADAAFHNQVAIELDLFQYATEYDGDIVTARDWIISTWTQ